MKMYLDYSRVSPSPGPVPSQDPPSMLGFSRRASRTLPMVSTQPRMDPPTVPSHTLKQIINTPPSPPGSAAKTMAWGQPTWFLFHTLAHKVKTDTFVTIRKQLLDVIYTISINLPCPTCAEHAKRYLDGINFQNIQTQEQLKRMLFDFHNSVNSLKKYPVFLYADLDDKYTHAITRNIMLNFMSHFEKKTKSIRLIADDMHRQRIVAILKSWFSDNLKWFDE